MATGEESPKAGAGRWLIAVIPLAVFLALAAVFFWQLEKGGASRDLPSVLIGKPAPVTELAPLEGLTSNGNQVPGLSAGMFKGEVTLLNVWASWCVPCRQEHPILFELAKDRRFQLVGMNYKDATDNALRFLGSLGNPFSAVGVDPNGKMAIEWGVYGVPETYLIGKDGMIALKHVGPIDPQILQNKIMPAIEKALAQPES
jgi:cytochrome c biogenesis protein CcmG/thiol:disulfide interchange protein DsbE